MQPASMHAERASASTAATCSDVGTPDRAAVSHAEQATTGGGGGVGGVGGATGVEVGTVEVEVAAHGVPAPPHCPGVGPMCCQRAKNHTKEQSARVAITIPSTLSHVRLFFSSTIGSVREAVAICSLTTKRHLVGVNLVALRPVKNFRTVAEDVSARCTEPASNQEALDLMWNQCNLL